MTCTSISERTTNFSARAISSSRLFVLLLAAMFASVLPAHAQSNDAWKSAAIIGGSTAAGAYVGYRVGGSTGAYIGAATGAAAGYAIDQRRRQAEYNNGYYGDNGDYSPNDGGGYSGDDYPQSRRSGRRGNYPQSGDDGGYYGGSPNGYPADYRSNFNASSRQR